MPLSSVSSPSSSSSRVAGQRIIRVDVTSDPNCPFCILGIRQLMLSIEKYNTSQPSRQLVPHVRILPFQLSGELSATPIDRNTYLSQKLGEARHAAVERNLDEKFRTVGLERSKNGEISSSHHAQRLEAYALFNSPPNHLPLGLDILKSYHIDGIHNSHIPTLARLAVKHGLFQTESIAETWLASDALDMEVRRAYVTAHRLGVTGVPFFVFQGKWAASGAMGVDEFVTLLEEIVKREDEPSLSPSPTDTLTSGEVVGKVTAEQCHLKP
ncbi:thioredoxin-like protein [Naematelia encephala]|uniref:Thioredoxin-like protein n=1 Tax=Naematelia encephala TaxID=71784 RepID=A0A1Y2BJP9_9TREE|nr:thioredoxin-like protein [Naematelia encephala]